jgi:hypothetical protein
VQVRIGESTIVAIVKAPSKLSKSANRQEIQEHGFFGVLAVNPHQMVFWRLGELAVNLLTWLRDA